MRHITALFLLAVLYASSAPTSTSAQPVSAICKQFPYTHYYSVTNTTQLKQRLAAASAGDLIEVSGLWNFGTPPVNPFINASRGYEDGSNITSSDSVVIKSRSGNSTHFITLCGTAIIDGSDVAKYRSTGLLIKNCTYLRVAGLTFQWVRKGVDVQNSTHIDIYKVKTQYTLQEGMRFRYNTTLSQARYNFISYTGYMWEGYGEGIYIGTSKSNSIEVGLPQDWSNNNTFFQNSFGKNVTAESIDVKEFTSFGKIYQNKFNGTGLSGINGARSAVVVKGNQWQVFNNNCTLSLSGGICYRVDQQYSGWGNKNVVSYDECIKVPSNGYCAYVHTSTTGNTVGCLKLTSTRCSMCNCNSKSCSKTPKPTTPTSFAAISPEKTATYTSTFRRDPRLEAPGEKEGFRRFDD